METSAERSWRRTYRFVVESRTWITAIGSIVFSTVSAGVVAPCCAQFPETLAPIVHRSRDQDQLTHCECGQWTCPACQRHCDCGHDFGGTPTLAPVIPAPRDWASPDGTTASPSSPGTASGPYRGQPRLEPEEDRPPYVSPPSAERSPMTGTSEMPEFAFSEQAAAGAASTLAVPNMIGPSFNGGRSFLTVTNRVPYSLFARGYILQSANSGLDSSLVYETLGSNDEIPDDFYSVGQGQLISDRQVVFAISEPVPPSDAPTSPGPDFSYDGGTAVGPFPFDDGDLWRVNYSFSEKITLVVPDPAETVVGRVKIAENTSPIPRDRVFVNYSLFDSVPLFAGGVTVNRFSPGFEKTFLAGLGSFEMRFPLASTLDSTIVLDGVAPMGRVEFGNLYMAAKCLLVRSNRAALSGGIVATVPTADDLRILAPGGTELVRVQNETVHLMPFLGWLVSSGPVFMQGFLDLDIDTNGNSVYVNQYGQGLRSAGRIQGATLLDINLSSGYWLFRRSQNNCAPTSLNGLAAMCELHISRSLQELDYVSAEDFRVGQPRHDLQQVAGVLGGALEFGAGHVLTVGYAVPIGNGADQAFDGELRAFWNKFF